MPVSDLAAVAAVILVSFLPPVLLAVRLRSLEQRRREPWRNLVKAFLWGATGAVLLTLLIQVFLLDLPFADFPLSAGLFTLVVAAPIVEEVAKAVGLGFVKDADPEPEDGYIYGGAVGMGFAATENVFYVLTSLALGGVPAGAVTLVYRSIATLSLHASASALAGRGIWKIHRGRSMFAFFPFLIGAIALHATFNWLVGLGLLAGLLLALAVAVATYVTIERRVRALDARGSLRPEEPS